ncbi:MAG: phosphonoacetaldehyde reductase [Chrysiogenia bacterium]
MWHYTNPVVIHWTDDLAATLPALIIPGKGLLFVYSPAFLNTLAADSRLDWLGRVPVYSDIEANPTEDNMQQALDFAQQIAPDWILAVGGGSVIDTAKVVRLALACGCTHINDLLAAIPTGIGNRGPLLAAAPTTHGTGAELTMWATIWDKKDSRKHSLSHPGMWPDFAVYCPALTRSLPLSASFASSLDALAHAMEALWNRNENPLSDEFALAAAKLVLENIELLTDPVPDSVRANLLRASLFAGLAFSNTKTAAAHSISYPLTLRFGIPHGIACSMPLLPLWNINAPQIPAKANRMRILLDGTDVAESLGRMQRFVASRMPFSLSAYGVGPADLDALVRESFTKGRMDNNIVALKKADVRAILKTILNPPQE